MSVDMAFTVLIVTAVAIFGGGTMAAIIVGREVPAALWAIDGVLANAIVAMSGLYAQRVMAREALGHMSDALSKANGVKEGK